MDSEANFITNCPICGSKSLHYAFMLNGHRMVECSSCDFLMRNPLPSCALKATQIAKEYLVPRAHIEASSFVRQRVDTSIIIEFLGNLLKSRGFNLSSYCNLDILYVGSFGHLLETELPKAGLNLKKIQFLDVNFQDSNPGMGNPPSNIVPLEVFMKNHRDYLKKFDIVIIDSQLMRTEEPKEFLKLFWSTLKVNGTIFCLLPYFDSNSVKDRRDSLRPEWNYLSYFSLTHLEALLFQAGFSNIITFKANKSSLNPNPHGENLNPSSVDLRSKASYVCASAEKIKSNDQLLLSVVMPAFNEASTIEEAIRRVLNKEISGIDIELILIESNSSDGTREKVLSFSSNPRVKIILEDVPQGKGHAVRAGLKNAVGDFILIQDADDEYDIEDYDALLEPLRDGRQKFVLGARHGSGGWKMRRFDDQPFRALVLNCGHWGFTFLINATCFVWLKDPFTMYKVFRRDCLRGLPLECNRFDFDHELVIKLIRKGYRPIEIPVNYRSRSFLQGKKVRIFADPLTWLKAIIKYRFQKI